MPIHRLLCRGGAHFLCFSSEALITWLTLCRTLDTWILEDMTAVDRSLWYKGKPPRIVLTHRSVKTQTRVHVGLLHNLGFYNLARLPLTIVACTVRGIVRATCRLMQRMTLLTPEGRPSRSASSGCDQISTSCSNRPWSTCRIVVRLLTFNNGNEGSVLLISMLRNSVGSQTSLKEEWGQHFCNKIAINSGSLYRYPILDCN